MLDEPLYPERPFNNHGEVADYITEKSYLPQTRVQLQWSWGRLLRRLGRRPRWAREPANILGDAHTPSRTIRSWWKLPTPRTSRTPRTPR